MNETVAMICPVCLQYDGYSDDQHGTIKANCPKCGEFRFTETARAMLLDEADICLDSNKPRLGPKGSRKRANASGWIRENQNHWIGSKDVPTLAKIPSLNPTEKADKLLEAVKAASDGQAGKRININTPALHAACWAIDRKETRALARILADKGLVRIGSSGLGDGAPDFVEVTGAGWELNERKDSGPPADEDPIFSKNVEELLNMGEGTFLEFKQTMRVNTYTGEKDNAIELEVLKTLAAFLNAKGGTLLIGVKNDGTPVGIGADRFKDEDRALQHLVNLVRDRISPIHASGLQAEFQTVEGNRVLLVRCRPGSIGAWVNDGDKPRFFVRTGNTTNELLGPDITSYYPTRFNR